MALANCRVCGGQLPPKIKACPRCGTKVQRRALLLVIPVFVITVLVGALYRKKIDDVPLPALHPAPVAAVVADGAPVDPAALVIPAWLIFATTDPATQQVVRRMRLLEDAPAPVAAANAANGTNDGSAVSVLELRTVGAQEEHAILTLRQTAPEVCIQLSAIDTQFDQRPKVTFPVLGTVVNGACDLEITGFDRFLERVRYANRLTVSVDGGGGKTRILKFNVYGLAWGG